MKKILDACCGSRMFWFDKNNPDVIFADSRELETELCDGRKLVIKPDEKIDFRDMPYPDNSWVLGKGKSPPDIVTLCYIADRFNVSVEGISSQVNVEPDPVTLQIPKTEERKDIEIKWKGIGKGRWESLDGRIYSR